MLEVESALPPTETLAAIIDLFADPHAGDPLLGANVHFRSGDRLIARTRGAALLGGGARLEPAKEEEAIR